MKKFILFLGILVLVTGCAFTKQAVQDYNTGKTTPLIANEESPSVKGTDIGNTVAALPVPFAPIAGGVVATLATLFFTWQRGASIRKNDGVVPASAATASNAPHVVQDIANVFTGAFQIIGNTSTSLTGSIVQRIWKVALAVGVAGTGVAASDPSVGAFLMAHPWMDAIFVAASSGLAGLEKGLSNVPAPAVVTPVVTT